MKKNGINIIVLLLFVLFSSTIISCGGGGGGSGDNDSNSDSDSTNTEVGTIIESDNIRETNSFFISDYEIQSLQLSQSFSNTTYKNIGEGNSVRTLLFLDNNSKKRPLTFKTSKSKRVILLNPQIKTINNDYYIISFSALSDFNSTFNSNTTVLFNIQTGKCYNVSNYDFNTAIISSNNLFVCSEGTIYKISLNNLTTAVPLNNKDFYPIYDIFAILGKWAVCRGSNSTSFNSLVDTQLQELTKHDSGLSLYRYILFKNENEDLFCLRYKKEAEIYYTVIEEITLINDEIVLTEVDRVEGTFIKNFAYENSNGIEFFQENDSPNMDTAQLEIYLREPIKKLYLANGYVMQKAVVKNGNSFRFTPITENGSTCYSLYVKPVFKNGKIYTLNSATSELYRCDLIGTSSGTFSIPNVAIPTDSSINAISLVGNNLIYYKYITPTTVGTFSILLSELDNISTKSVLLSENIEQINDIVEFSF